MKKCPECKSIDLDNSSQFCQNCGFVLLEMNLLPLQLYSDTESFQLNDNTKKLFIINIILIFISLITGFFTFFINFNIYLLYFFFSIVTFILIFLYTIEQKFDYLQFEKKNKENMVNNVVKLGVRLSFNCYCR